MFSSSFRLPAGCLSANVNVAEINMEVQPSLWGADFTPRSGVASTHGSFRLNSQKHLLTVSYKAYDNLHLPSPTVHRVPSPHFPSTCSLLPLGNSHAGRWEACPTVVWFAFSWWSVVLNISSCVNWPFVCLILRNVCSDPWLTFKGPLECAFIYYWVSVPQLFGIFKPQVKCLVCKYVSHSVNYLFTLLSK